MKKIVIALFAFVILLVFSVPVAARQNTEIDQKVNQIVSNVLSSSGEYTFDDILYVLDHDDEAGYRILEHLDEVVVPLESNSPTTFSTKNTTIESQGTVEYNPDTGTETVQYDNASFYDAPLNLTTNYMSEGGPILPFSTPLLRAVDWTESNPQNYADTKTIFKLYIYKQNDTSTVYGGTAFKISGNYLATAGHCLYDHGSLGGWAGNILCIPAIRPTAPTKPLGESYAVNSNMYVDDNWKIWQNTEWDFGILQTRNSLSTGAMGRRCVGDTASINGKDARVAGYPADSTLLHLSWGKVQETGRKLAITDYTRYGGQSGAPVTDRDGYVIGIHRGHSLDGSGVFVKFDNYLFNKINSYK